MPQFWFERVLAILQHMSSLQDFP